MLTIRKAQIDTLTDNIRKAYELKCVGYLRNKYPDETRDMNDDGLLQFVREGIENAAKYTIVERNDVSSFLEYMTCFGKDFETNPANEWATKVFRIRNLPGEERIIRLMTNKPL
jgi:hypothetical protein